MASRESSGDESCEAKVIAGPTAKFVLECAVEHQQLPQTQMETDFIRKIADVRNHVYST